MVFIEIGQKINIKVLLNIKSKNYYKIKNKKQKTIKKPDFFKKFRWLIKYKTFKIIK